MSLQRLCYLVNKKNELVKERRKLRHRLFRVSQKKELREISLSIEGKKEYAKRYNIPVNCLKVRKRDFKVDYLRAKIAYDSINLKIAEHSQEYGAEIRSLYKDIKASPKRCADNIVERIVISNDIIGHRVLYPNDIMLESDKYEFEQILLNYEEA